MKRVIFLNRFFFPDHSATSQLLTDLAFHLAALGIETHVITSRQLYDQPDARLQPEETVRNVCIHRVATTQFGRSGLAGRSIDYISYYISARRSLLTLAKRDDIVVAMTDPPLISIIAMNAVKRRGAQLVNWLQDIYPETAIELNVSLFKGPIGPAISLLRDRSLKAARANVVVGQQMASQVVSRKTDSNHVHVINNWVDDADITPIPQAGNPLRRKWQLQDKFVVAYSGNLGRAHEFETILAAAQRLKDNPRIVFVCIGGGHKFEDLRSLIGPCGLHRTFRLFPYQNADMLKYSLGVADVHWISLKPQLEGLIVPSKFYGVAAAGKPILAISSRQGEIARLIDQHGCGIVIEPGDAPGLASTIVDLSVDPQRVAGMGERARAMLEAHFSRQQALAKWRNLLEGLMPR